VEEEEDLGSIRVSFGERKEVEIVMSYVKILASISAGGSWSSTSIGLAARTTKKGCIRLFLRRKSRGGLQRTLLPLRRGG
jgi:hypothetical protein